MWHQYLQENRFISTLYSAVPQLNNVRISALKILDEGRRVTIQFDMPVYTEKPPQKWVDSGYNTVFVEVDLFDIREISLKSMDKNYRGDIEIKKDENGLIAISIHGSIQATIKADVGMIQSVRAYINT